MTGQDSVQITVQTAHWKHHGHCKSWFLNESNGLLEITWLDGAHTFVPVEQIQHISTKSLKTD